MKYILLFCLALPIVNGLAGQQSWHMTLLSRFDNDNLPNSGGIVYNDVWGYANDDGVEIAILGSLDSIFFFDITDPGNPTRINVFKGIGSTIWREFKTYNHYLYAIGDNTPEGLAVFDLQYVPDSVVFIQRDDTTFSTAHMLFVDTATAHLYIAGSRNGGQSYDLVMMDLSANPSSPTLIKRIDLPGNYMHDLFVRNDTAYCSHGNNGFYIYDIDSVGNFAEISELTTYPQQGYNHSSWLHANNELLVFADETHNTGLKLVDLKNKKQPKIHSIFRSALLSPDDTASIAHNPYFKGDLIFVSYYHDGIQVFDATDPKNPVKHAYYDTEPSNTNYQGYAGAWGVYPYLPSSTILGSDIKNGLFMLRIDVILALEEIVFSANRKLNSIKLQWLIKPNDDIDWIALEKSEDGVHFRTIASLPKDVTAYSDAELLANTQYYRLRVHNKSGSRLSKIISVDGNYSDQSLYIQNGQLHCRGNCPTEFFSLDVFNIDGKLLESHAGTKFPVKLRRSVGSQTLLLQLKEDSGPPVPLRKFVFFEEH